jgi:hypothetical protein
MRYARLHARASLRNLLPAVGELLATVGADIGGRGTFSVLETKGLVAGIRHYFRGNAVAALCSLPFVAWTLLTYGLAVPGAIRLARMPETRGSALLLLAVAGCLLLAPGGASHPQFRVPAMPILALFAGNGLVVALGHMAKYVPKLGEG